MLRSPTHAIVGSQKPDTTCDLLQRFGFVRKTERQLSAEAARALYALDVPVRQCEMVAPGADRGGIHVVETPHASSRFGPFDPRPVAIDLYTRDIGKSLRIAQGAGLHCGQLVDYAVGPLQLKEVEVEDDDGLRLVFLELENRRPSLLDQAPDRLHSEVHSIVFAVPSAEDAVTLWRDGAGLDVLVDAPIRGPVISQLMGLPKDEVPIRFVLFCDEEAHPARLEVIEFIEDPAPPRTSGPLRAGLHAAAFQVDDLEAAMERLGRCTFRTPAEVEGRRGVAGEAPGGLCFELWQTPS